MYFATGKLKFSIKRQRFRVGKFKLYNENRYIFQAEIWLFHWTFFWNLNFLFLKQHNNVCHEQIFQLIPQNTSKFHENFLEWSKRFFAEKNSLKILEFSPKKLFCLDASSIVACVCNKPHCSTSSNQNDDVPAIKTPWGKNPIKFQFHFGAFLFLA